MTTYQKEETIQTYSGWKEFYEIYVSDKLEFFTENGRLVDVIFAQQWTACVCWPIRSACWRKPKWAPAD